MEKNAKRKRKCMNEKNGEKRGKTTKKTTKKLHVHIYNSAKAAYVIKENTPRRAQFSRRLLPANAPPRHMYMPMPTYTAHPSVYRHREVENTILQCQ